METTYINKKTKGIIDPSSIIHDDDEKIIVTNTNCWQLIPKSSIETQKIFSEYYPEEPVPQIAERASASLVEDTKSNTYTHKAVYEFGFKDFAVYTRYPNESSGIISMPISVENTDHISIAAKINNGEHGSIEFWIIDGVSEVPILPEGTKNIYKEKLFYDLETQFPIDYVQGITPIIYEDNIAIGKEYSLLTAEDFSNHSYYMTYTAAGSPDLYVPTGKEIRLKIIIRQYDEVPVGIDHVILYRHGGSKVWN